MHTLNLSVRGATWNRPSLSPMYTGPLKNLIWAGLVRAQIEAWILKPEQKVSWACAQVSVTTLAGLVIGQYPV